MRNIFLLSAGQFYPFHSSSHLSYAGPYLRPTFLFSCKNVLIKTGYMIVENFGASFGQQLPLVVRNKKMTSEPTKMRNLFRGISRIILALAHIPQPKIGALRILDDVTISLNNRPITSSMFLLENEGAARTIYLGETARRTSPNMVVFCGMFPGYVRCKPGQ